MTKAAKSTFKAGGGRRMRFAPAASAPPSAPSVLPTPIKSESDKKSYKAVRLPNGLTALLISDPSPPSAADEEEEEEEEDESGEEEGEEEEEEGEGEEDEGEGEEEEEEGEEEEEDEKEDEGEESDGESPKGRSGGQSEEKMAACALCIRVGSYSDPPNVQGMAHFVEHMVFMGSAKYPGENDFDAFIRKTGGSDNACTDCETTTFHFEAQENRLAEAMDRFAQFFVAPLMKQEAMRRETEAIESEFALATPSDASRREQLLSSALAAGHPGRTFMWGNRESLSREPPERLHRAAHEFRERHYSAHRMTVAVQARLPLDALERYATDTFGRVPNNRLPPDDFSKFAFAEESAVAPEFHAFYRVKAVTQTTSLTLTWQMKSFQGDYRTKPHQYVAWITGHEGAGSLLSYLRNRVWAMGLSSGVSDGGIDHTSLLSLFSVSLVLTEEGLKNVDRVLDAVFGYINMLKRDCPCERIFDEIRRIEEINFRFQDEGQPCDNVEQLAENMQFFPPEHYMTGQDLYFEYDPKGIMYVIDHLSPETVNVMLQTKSYEKPMVYDRVEEWFGTEYKRTEFDEETIERWKNMIPDKNFYLPDENPFIPDDFTLIAPQPDFLIDKLLDGVEDLSEKSESSKWATISPALIKKNDMMELWYKPDYRFHLPYTHVCLKFILPADLASAKTACLIDLWCNALGQLLTEKLYAADVTGLSRSMQQEDNGILCKLHGFSEKLPIVIDVMTQMLKNYSDTLTEALFTALVDIQTKAYTNAVMKPSKLVKDVRLSILMNQCPTTLDKLKELKTITFEDLCGFGAKFLNKLYVKMLMQGNLSKEDSLGIASAMEANLKWNGMTEEERPKILVNKIPIGERHCRISSFNMASENSIITNYYQYGVSDIRNCCIVELIMQIMEEPLFNTLRTKEQLGYSVYGMYRYTSGVLGFSVTAEIQAGKYCTSYIDLRIEEFLKEFLKTVREMGPDSFEQSKTALIKILKGVDVELKDEVRRNWDEISSAEYQFDKLALEIECLKTLTQDDVVTWLDEQTRCGSGKNFRKLSVQIVGHKQTNEATQHVDKKVKLEHQMSVVLNGCNYSVKHLEAPSEVRVEYIASVASFRNTLEKYPERQTTLKFLNQS